MDYAFGTFFVYYCVSGYGRRRTASISANVNDGTGVTNGSRVTIRNCERIATLARYWIRVAEAWSDTLAADDHSF